MSNGYISLDEELSLNDNESQKSYNAIIPTKSLSEVKNEIELESNKVKIYTNKSTKNFYKKSEINSNNISEVADNLYDTTVKLEDRYSKKIHKYKIINYIFTLFLIFVGCCISIISAFESRTTETPWRSYIISGLGLIIILGVFIQEKSNFRQKVNLYNLLYLKIIKIRSKISFLTINSNDNNKDTYISKVIKNFEKVKNLNINNILST